jgi:hypothetical protein
MTIVPIPWHMSLAMFVPWYTQSWKRVVDMTIVPFPWHMSIAILDARRLLFMLEFVDTVVDMVIVPFPWHMGITILDARNVLLLSWNLSIVDR